MTQTCKGSERSHWGSWATRRTSRADLSSCLDEDTTNFRMVLKRLNCELCCLSWRLPLVSFSPWSWQEPQENGLSPLVKPFIWSSFTMLPRCYGSLPSVWIFSQSLGSCLSFSILFLTLKTTAFVSRKLPPRAFSPLLQPSRKSGNIHWAGCFFFSGGNGMYLTLSLSSSRSVRATKTVQNYH